MSWLGAFLITFGLMYLIQISYILYETISLFGMIKTKKEFWISISPIWIFYVIVVLFINVYQSYKLLK